MARTVEDTALLLQAAAGYDPRDPTSINVPVPDYTSALRENVKGISIGVPRDHIDRLGDGMDKEVLDAMDRALSELEGLGAQVKDVRIPSLEHGRHSLDRMWYVETYTPRRKTSRPDRRSSVTWRWTSCTRAV